MNSKELQLVNYEQAKRLKKFGFDWECDKLYVGKQCVRAGTEYFPLERDVDTYSNWNDVGYEWNDGVQKEWISAPTVALAFKWFRDEKDILCEVAWNAPIFETKKYTYTGLGKRKDDFANTIVTETFDTYESAESALLDELLDLIQN